MKATQLLIPFAGLMMLASPATAQNAATGQPATGASAETMLIEVEDDKLVVMPFNLTAEQVSEMDVYDATGERIGEIDDVLMQPGGPVVAVSVEAGGFLGIGERDIIFGTDSLTLDAGRLVTNLSREQIEALPDWND